MKCPDCNDTRRVDTELGRIKCPMCAKSSAATHVKTRMTWGVMLRTGTGGKGRAFEWTGPLFTGWFTPRIENAAYTGEPTRILIFQTRRHARAFCDVRNASRCLPDWRFYPVRVKELWEFRR